MRNRLGLVAALATGLCCATLVTSSRTASASDPTSQDVTVPTTDGDVVEKTWTGTVPAGATPNSDCMTPAGTSVPSTDAHTINLTVPAGTYNNVNVSAKFVIEWDDGGQDMILTVSQDGTEVASSDGGNPHEEVDIDNPAQATYQALACAFQVTGATNYRGKLTLKASAKVASGSGGGSTGPQGDPLPAIPPTPGQPRFYNFSPGPGLGEGFGEPSVGYNLTTHHSMFLSGLTTFQVTYPENIAPAGSVPESCPCNWKDVSSTLTHVSTLDPIMFTDQTDGRTFVSQLNSKGAGPALAGFNSLMAYTDTDGEPDPTTGQGWTPAQVNPPDTTNDHQTVGGGPYPASVPLGTPANKNSAVYYCAQDGNLFVATSAAYCSRSDDGGLNFAKGTQVYNGAVSCGSGNTQMIHGHVKVAPDGTVYLPNSTCGSQQAVVSSTDAGTTWAVHKVPTSISPAGIIDPSVGISHDAPVAPATSNTIYVCYTGLVPGGNSTDNHAFVAMSKDRGATWTTPKDVGASLGINNAVFAEMVVGDSDRAACTFLGTTASGDHQAANFRGDWYGISAFTYDGGANWVAVNATPNGPVQREACIWNGGGANPCRNLLDFNDATLDEKGRVIFGFTDGCTGDCETGGANSYSAKATIARQSGGKGLYAKYDTPEPVAPQRACLSGRRDDIASYLQWAVPDHGGSAITAYKVFRSTTPGTETLLGQTGGVRTVYTDRTVDPTVEKYYYKVVAVNDVGESLDSNEIMLLLGQRLETTGPCALPGVQAIVDAAGDASDGQPAHDITSVNMAELMDPAPNVTGHASKLYFSMKVASLSSVPPGFRWAVRFSVEGVTPPTDASGGASEDFFVSMVTSDNAAPAFTWGVTSVPQNASRVFTTKGNLTADSNYQADGTITLVINKSDIGNPAPGKGILGMLGSVRATAPSAVPGTGGTNETIPDSTGGGSYTLRPDDLCLPNTAPVADLKADVLQGSAPLTVNFDGSGSSDADTGIDTIASYTFNFGDGNGDTVQNCSADPVGCSKIAHTFADNGTYYVKLVVTDSRGKLSSNVAQLPVLVGIADTDVGHVDERKNNQLVGALSLGGLAWLFVAGAVRSRRRS